MGLYASDGLCHNAETGTYGHECGKPATWIGTKPGGWQSGFCDRCKEHGAERHGFLIWKRVRSESYDNETYLRLRASQRVCQTEE